jgi:hypothetical protein
MRDMMKFNRKNTFLAFSTGCLIISAVALILGSYNPSQKGGLLIIIALSLLSISRVLFGK